MFMVLFLLQQNVVLFFIYIYTCISRVPVLALLRISILYTFYSCMPYGNNLYMYDELNSYTSTLVY